MGLDHLDGVATSEVVTEDSAEEAEAEDDSCWYPGGDRHAGRHVLRAEGFFLDWDTEEAGEGVGVGIPFIEEISRAFSTTIDQFSTESDHCLLAP